MSDPQLNVRMDIELRTAFVAAVKKRGESVPQVVQRFAQAYIDAGAELGIRHLDGNLCPLHKLIDGLSAECATVLHYRMGTQHTEKPKLGA